MPHIRPQKRTPAAAPPAPSSEATQHTVASWTQPRSILKTQSKYTKSTTEEDNPLEELAKMQLGTVQERPRRKKKKTPVVVKPTVSDEVKQEPPNTTTTTNTAKPSSTDQEDILSFNSIADLMEAAGQPMPSPQEEPQVIEAGLEFSCLSPEEYDTFRQEQRQLQYDIFTGQTQVGHQQQQQEEADKENTDDEEEDDDLWDLLEEEEELDDDDPATHPTHPRAFLKIHNALSQWITPQAVQYVQQLQKLHYQESPPLIAAVPVDDIAASRCAGLVALLQMHTAPASQALRITEDRRTADRRLMDWIRTCDFSQPAPKLDSALARALTCVLLDTLLGVTAQRTVVELPGPCQVLEMTVEEYRYLVVSAIVRFGADSSSDS